MTRVHRLISVTAQKRPPVSRFCVRKGKASAGVSPGAFCAVFVPLCLGVAAGSVGARIWFVGRNPPQNAVPRERLRGNDMGGT